MTRGKSFNLSIFQSFNSRSGQSLAEILIAVSLIVVFIGGVSFVIASALRGMGETKTAQVAAGLAREYLDTVKSIGESNWNAVYNLAGKGPASQFHLVLSGGIHSISTGTTSTTMGGMTFTRSFSVENVGRDGSGNILQSGGTDDASTQKITANISWGGGITLSAVEYILRTQNVVFNNRDWSGGAGQESFATSPDGTVVNNRFTTSTPNIDFSTGGSIRIILP